MLNQWAGTDVPTREDFNSDNAIIDGAITSHKNDEEVHITDDERERWNLPYHLTSYVGNGTKDRLVTTNCPFNARWGIVYAVSAPISVVDVANESDYNYFAVMTTYGGTIGARLDGENIRVTSSSTAVEDTEYPNLNERNMVYAVILFR